MKKIPHLIHSSDARIISHAPLHNKVNVCTKANEMIQQIHNLICYKVFVSRKKSILYPVNIATLTPEIGIVCKRLEDAGYKVSCVYTDNKMLYKISWEE
jgi:hypothetical protein